MASRVALLNGIPVDVRRIMELPTSTVDEELLQRNAEKHGEAIEKMVGEVTQAWMSCGQKFTSNKFGFGINWNLEGFGLVPVLLQNDEAIDDQWRAHLMKHMKVLDNQNALPTDRNQSRSVCVHGQTELLKALFDKDESAQLFTLAFEFVEHHARQEPRAQAIRSLFEEMAPEARNAIGLPGLRRYQFQKPRTWKDEISLFLSVTYFATMAWNETDDAYGLNKANPAIEKDDEEQKDESDKKNDGDDEAGKHDEDECQWLAIRCWVKCDLDGIPLKPYTYAGPCSCTPQPGRTTTSKAQTTLAAYLKPGMVPALRPAAPLVPTSWQDHGKRNIINVSDCEEPNEKIKQHKKDNIATDSTDVKPHAEARGSADPGAEHEKTTKRKSGRRSPFTDDQKEWILGNLAMWATNPTNKMVRTIVEKGCSIRILDADTDPEAVRNVLRLALDKIMERKETGEHMD